jgi:hypothetical protein
MASSMSREGNNNPPVGSANPDNKARIQIDVETKYTVGGIVKLLAAENDSLVTLEIVKQLKVGNGQTSQVIVAKCLPGSILCMHNEKIDTKSCEIIAKFYDANYGPLDWPGPSIVCADSKAAEKKAYDRLLRLQGFCIPKFYGEYRFREAANGYSEIPVLLLQLIPDPTLAEYRAPDFPSDKLSKLESQAFQMLNEIHAAGVCHGDVEAWNLLWNPEEEKLTLIDFEEATFGEVRLEERKRDDFEMVRSILCELGVKDERNVDALNSLIPGWIN